MGKLIKAVFLLLSVIILSQLVTIMMDFFAIDFAVYGGYLLWFIACALFFAILSGSDTSIFSPGFSASVPETSDLEGSQGVSGGSNIGIFITLLTVAIVIQFIK